MAKAKSTKEDRDLLFVWTDSEVELLLETVKAYAAACMYEGKDWEGVKSKYDKILALLVERYPNVPSEEFPKQITSDGESPFTRERIATKLKAIRKNYKKAVDTGRRSGGGRIVMTFYDICSDIWAGSPATKSIEGQHRNAKLAYLGLTLICILNLFF